MGLFGPPPYQDAELGELQHKRGRWRGTLALAPGLSVSLAISGGGREPDPAALAAARAIPAAFPAWRPAIERALFEHYSPYAEAVAAGEESAPVEDLPAIRTPDQVWPYVTWVFASVAPLDGTLTTELGCTTAWDEEHTLGARFQSGALLELNGSVLAP